MSRRYIGFASAAFATMAICTSVDARFLQVDPVGYKDQVNLYEYVGDDPLNKTDPKGTDEIDVFRPFALGLADHEAEFVGNKD